MDIIQTIFDVLNGRTDIKTPRKTDLTILELLGFDNDNSPRSAELRHTINFVPSDNVSKCCKEAIFVSISHSPSALKLRKDQLISLDQMLPIIVQQVQGTCFGINKKITLLTDKIDVDQFKIWKDNLHVMIVSGVDLRVIYIGGSKLKDITDIALI
jgi:hypothetical protein